jgi:uncharacterized integral membrane protein (TIGR00697 family)
MFEKLFLGIDRPLAAKLVAFHIFIIAFSNWLVNYKFGFFGHPLTYSAFTFPLIVVATDLTVRLVGRDMGRTVVSLAFIPAIFVSMLVVAATGAPTSVAVRIGLGSGMAYTISTLLDVYVFQYFREQYKSWWIAPTFSAVASTFIDTYTFFGVAFYNSADAFMAEHWSEVATGQMVTKLVVSLLVILPAYGVLLSYLQKKVVKLQ